MGDAASSIGTPRQIPFYKEEQLSYGNLLAACHGSEGTADSHCDVHKGSQRLSRNPARPEHAVESLIRYLGDGTIQSADPEFERELNDVLNLNASFLRANRRSVMAGFTSGLGQPPAGIRNGSGLTHQQEARSLRPT